MSFILFCILPSTLIPRGGGVFLTSGSSPTLPRAEPPLPSSQADMYSIVKGRYQHFLSFFKVFGRQDITMTNSWTETFPTQLIASYFYNSEKKPLVCCGLVERYA